MNFLNNKKESHEIIKLFNIKCVCVMKNTKIQSQVCIKKNVFTHALDYSFSDVSNQFFFCFFFFSRWFLPCSILEKLEMQRADGRNKRIESCHTTILGTLQAKEKHHTER